MKTNKLVGMIIRCVLSRKSTDLYWDDEEPNATAGEDSRSAEIEESALLHRPKP
jgi:hypothetical protein